MTGRKKTKYSPETKAAALAALLAGQGVSEVAATYKLPSGTVKSWLNRLKVATPVASVASEERAAIGDLLTGYLTETLAALRAQSKVFADPAWLKQQTAADAAVLHGVMTDKSVRLLEALGAESPLQPNP